MIKATDRKLVVGLEIGTAKVAALVGEVLPDGMIMPRSWPSQASVRAGLSIFGRPGDEGNLVSIAPPYPLYIYP